MGLWIGYRKLLKRLKNTESAQLCEPALRRGSLAIFDDDTLTSRRGGGAEGPENGGGGRRAVGESCWQQIDNWLKTSSREERERESALDNDDIKAEGRTIIECWAREMEIADSCQLDNAEGRQDKTRREGRALAVSISWRGSEAPPPAGALRPVGSVVPGSTTSAACASRAPGRGRVRPGNLRSVITRRAHW